MCTSSHNILNKLVLVHIQTIFGHRLLVHATMDHRLHTPDWKREVEMRKKR